MSSSSTPSTDKSQAQFILSVISVVGLGGFVMLGVVLASQEFLDIVRPAIEAKGMAEPRGPAVELDEAKLERAKQEG